MRDRKIPVSYICFNNVSFPDYDLCLYLLENMESKSKGDGKDY